MSENETGGPAFPHSIAISPLGDIYTSDYSGGGMTLRDYFAAAALANVNICTGRAAEYDLREWFGENAQNISREQIAARQAINCADAMLKARSRSGRGADTNG